MKKLYMCVLAVAMSLNVMAQQTVKKQAERGDVQACMTLAKENIEEYRFEEAGDWLSKAEAALKKKKKSVPEELEQLQEEVSHGERMLRGTDQILVVDSMVVDKMEFLQAYKLSEETGSLDSYAHYFTSVEDGSIYITELGDRLYCGKRMEDGSKRICTSDQLADGSWGEPHEVTGIESEGTEEDYPFVTADGTTLYFASKGRADGMGGYDIYVTRATEGSHYLKPENLGFPYNSPYNDYMMVIDELNELGWFASDRYQPEGKVCIYIFVPNESRHPFDYDNGNPETIRETALLRNIKVTQDNLEQLEKGKLHLQQALLYRPEKKEVKEFTLVIDDKRVYSSYAHFRNPQASMLCKEWVDKRKQLEALRMSLEKNRQDYSAGQYKLASKIRTQEAEQEALALEVKAMEKQIRKLEVAK